MSGNRWETYWLDRANHDWWERPAPEIMELIATLSPEACPRVLDLGCGLGRHAVAFALAGFQVTATDQSTAAVAHLDGWAAGLGLAIRTQVCDLLDNGFAPESFDIVISYNVLYHGLREQFSRAIAHIYTLLAPGGLFFFTCPTRRDGKYGFGEQVAPHTYLCAQSVTPGDIHYFADEHDLDILLADYRLLSRSVEEGYWNNQGTPQFYSNWQILAEREG